MWNTNKEVYFICQNSAKLCNHLQEYLDTWNTLSIGKRIYPICIYQSILNWSWAFGFSTGIVGYVECSSHIEILDLYVLYLIIKVFAMLWRKLSLISTGVSGDSFRMVNIYIISNVLGLNALHNSCFRGDDAEERERRWKEKETHR